MRTHSAHATLIKNRAGQRSDLMTLLSENTKAFAPRCRNVSRRNADPEMMTSCVKLPSTALGHCEVLTHATLATACNVILQSYIR